MIIRRPALTIAALYLAIAGAPMQSLAGTNETDPAIKLSPQLNELLQAEMAELAGGIQGIALALAAGDWQAIAATSEKMHASYIMKQSLTETQALELKQKLPADFKQFDADFHARAKKLGEAATSRDSELVAFHYSRLVEACASCHATYATQRFPGFVPRSQEPHEH